MGLQFVNVPLLCPAARACQMRSSRNGGYIPLLSEERQPDLFELWFDLLELRELIEGLVQRAD